MKPYLTACVLASFLLAGCESTRFEAAPVAEQPCDPTLAGHWWSLDKKLKQDGEVELDIGPNCRLKFIEHDQHTSASWGEATSLHVGRDAGRTYLWVDANWAEVRMGEEPRAEKGDVFVLRYRARGDLLELWQVDTKAIAHRVIDNEIKGDVHQADDELHVRLKKPVDPEALRARGFWDKDVLRFRRAPAEPSGA
jgi:hypothetical protein